MRAHVVSGNINESWQWQLPDVSEGQTIAFRMVEAAPGSGVPPDYIRHREPEEIAETKRLAAEGLAKAMEEKRNRASLSESVDPGRMLVLFDNGTTPHEH